MDFEELEAQTGEEDELDATGADAGTGEEQDADGEEGAQESLGTEEGSGEEEGGNDADTDAERQEKKKPHQTEENARNAGRRRQNERQKAYEQAILDVTGGKNPFTGEVMKDSHDIEEYKLMLQIQKDNGDPVADYPKYQKKAQREREQQQAEQDFFKQDSEDFSSKYPDIDINALVADEKFGKFAGARIGKEPLADIFTDFTDIVGEYEIKAEKQAAQAARKIVAKGKASPGSLSGATPSPKSYATMSDDEFDQIVEKALRGELTK